MSTGVLFEFYRSVPWLRCRDAYLKQCGGLCERCLSRGLIVPAVIVHHKKHLTPDNVSDPAISLAASNLMAVCRQCHSDIHAADNPRRRRYKVDAAGNVTPITI